MGCLRRVEPLGDNPRLYDLEGTGYILKYSAIAGTASLQDSCFQQKTISYLNSGFNPITHTWVDPGVSPVNEELSTTTRRSLSEATTGLNSADIK
jgi:GH43 family beta-xylosidase